MIEDMLSIIKALAVGAIVQAKWQFKAVRRKFMKGMRK